MASKLVPSDPAKVMVIRDVVPSTIATFSTPFWRFGRIKVGGRGTAVRMQSGGVAVFSPTALTDDVKAKVAGMGEVKYITAMDMEHHIFIGPWHEAFPNAKVIGPEGLPEKRKQQNNEAVPFASIFKAKQIPSVDAEFDTEFDYEYVYGHINKELVFLHKPTKTLIEADLIFNLPATEQFSKTGESATTGILTKIFGALQKTSGMAQKRLIWYGTSGGDKAGFHQSMAKINGWDFDRIIPCHGDVIETGGKGIFQHLMEWHIAAAKTS
ncbi:hypothetical protein EJ04DRAFT_511382 [Polyplosphaeria fusca]|uniref:Uncharacterized protein n=1 Tax=Polyplosphaeria fusca TaxID=682080 RepID=A0A9P4R2Z6_9PLEO|nr:hypothetical protein EJ04DRAFT_511382 [Polyplosphaeria fusca]